MSYNAAMPQPAFPSRRELLMLAALVVGHFAWTVVCFAVAEWISQEYRYGYDYERAAFAICMGSVAAQLVLAATWTALGSGSHLARVSGAMLLLFVAGYAMALHTDGFYSGDTSYGEVIIAGLICFLVLQLPFWLFRFIWGWRIVTRENVGANSGEMTGRLSMLHLMGWTVFAATLLALTRAFAFSAGDAAEFLGSILVVATIGVVVQLVFLWTILSPQRQSLFTNAAIILVVTGCATAGVYIYFGLTISRNVFNVYWSFLSLGGAYCSLLVGTLLIVRACGYRLAIASGERKLPDSA